MKRLKPTPRVRPNGNAESPHAAAARRSLRKTFPRHVQRKRLGFTSNAGRSTRPEGGLQCEKTKARESFEAGIHLRKRVASPHALDGSPVEKQLDAPNGNAEETNLRRRLVNRSPLLEAASRKQFAKLLPVRVRTDDSTNRPFAFAPRDAPRGQIDRRDWMDSPDSFLISYVRQPKFVAQAIRKRLSSVGTPRRASVRLLARSFQNAAAEADERLKRRPCIRHGRIAAHSLDRAAAVEQFDAPFESGGGVLPRSACLFPPFEGAGGQQVAKLLPVALRANAFDGVAVAIPCDFPFRQIDRQRSNLNAADRFPFLIDKPIEVHILRISLRTPSARRPRVLRGGGEGVRFSPSSRFRRRWSRS